MYEPSVISNANTFYLMYAKVLDESFFEKNFLNKIGQLFFFYSFINFDCQSNGKEVFQKKMVTVNQFPLRSNREPKTTLQ